jgi:cation diffusion facilitator family transporter
MTARLRLPADLASRAAGLSLFANFGLMLLKLGAGVITGSIAILSEGIDSAQDMIAAAIVLASVRIGRRPADLEHPYGHGRAETIAAALQAAILVGGASFIVFSGVDRLIDPPDTIGTSLGLAVMVVDAFVNLGVSGYAARVARLTHSPAIASDARHLMTNVVQAILVLVGLGLVAITGVVAFDALMALALAAYLYWTSGKILWAVAGDVLDVSLSARELARIEQLIELAGGRDILGYHRLRTRRSGQAPHIDFHLLLPREMTVAASHAIADRIESRLLEEWPNAEVVVHVEPEGQVYEGPLGNHDLRAPDERDQAD